MFSRCQLLQCKSVISANIEVRTFSQEIVVHTPNLDIVAVLKIYILST